MKQPKTTNNRRDNNCKDRIYSLSEKICSVLLRKNIPDSNAYSYLIAFTGFPVAAFKM